MYWSKSEIMLAMGSLSYFSGIAEDSKKGKKVRHNRWVCGHWEWIGFVSNWIALVTAMWWVLKTGFQEEAWLV